MNNGELGEKIAKELWVLTLTESGGAEDKAGIDAWEDGETIQIKYDGTIAKTGNVYHEIYEKSKGHTEQEWRSSPHNVKQYIFVTEGFAIKIRTNELAMIERHLRLIPISDTSMGFLIPMGKIKEREIKEWHNKGV